ncbi:MAG: hypothetical protein KAQ65_01270 [Candidatus Thorarchaeota archaeon]|nr:hypothetical protein [Candidatus Thorarchaeota archaeon]MCK5237946.1 hypothetical protein [Candidatus Thorarchaeota archaeon]
MDDSEEKDVAESQKLSKGDKKKIQDGACVNCAIVMFLFMVLMMAAMVL